LLNELAGKVSVIIRKQSAIDYPDYISRDNFSLVAKPYPYVLISTKLKRWKKKEKIIIILHINRLKETGSKFTVPLFLGYYIKNSQAWTFHVKEIGAYSLRVGEGELSKLKTLSYSSN
jgi:hypothetical protein